MAKSWCLILLIVLLHLSMANPAPDITTDQSALLALKARITSDPNGVLGDWIGSSPVCNWTGVTCGTRHRRVTELNISGMGFAGEAPPQLGNLSFLVSLDMSINYFTGIIPQELAHLRRLKFLQLSYNSFTSFDSFMNSFSNESKLEILDMSNNSLQGNIPESIGSLQKLMVVAISHNQLSGVIPAALANISSLEYLSLIGNSIQGSIPENIGNLQKLNFLNFGFNQLTGSIPISVSNISTLEYVTLVYNSLSGTLPDDMFLRLPVLKGFFLSHNQMQGGIPSRFASSPVLQMLSLSINYFDGVIPPEIDQLQMLQILYLGRNKLSGIIPSSLGNMSSLEKLDLSENSFEGPIPEAIGNLGNLDLLILGLNDLTGSIPDNIFNISTLALLDLIDNNLTGKLPSNICNSLPNLQGLYLSSNKLHGVLPSSIANCSQLGSLSIAENEFTGALPNSLGELRFLETLELASNSFSSQSMSSEFDLITSLTNCRYLRRLEISDNPLTGVLPASIGNLSNSIQLLSIARCKISGNIPNEIGNLSSLPELLLYENNLNGVILATIDGLHNIQRLILNSNQLRGSLPESLCNLRNLGDLNLGENQLTGPIPECFGNVSSLRKLYLDSNKLNSSIPESIWGLPNLLELDISSNSIIGPLSSQIGNLKAAIYVNLSKNNISGDIPDTFQGLQSMNSISFAHNKFKGSIPDSLGGMLDLSTMDLSDNNLSGTIPESLEALKHLVGFNVSFNQLSGEIPSGGPFINFTSQPFISNLALCGPQRYQVPPCKEPMISKSKLRKELRLAFIIIPIVAFLLACILTMLCIRRRRKNAPQNVSNLSLGTEIARISYLDILQSTDKFSDNNLLGKGSFGSVYKGVFRDGITLAIKVFNMQLEGALRTFDVECEVLRNLRHRNLVKVISSCSNNDFKALVLDYMPNGSLEKWLHSNEAVLSLMQRLCIMIDVATALEYLHYGYFKPVVHCDLKPSNILLDENVMGCVGDFGIAQLLGEEESRTHTRTLATIGYMAPEYGLEGRISTRCDVYSFGIMLLETFTGRQPRDEMFCENVNLKSWVKDALPNGLSHIVAANLTRPEDQDFSKKMSCVLSVLELALCCLEDSPTERINMKEVLAALQKIKNQLVGSSSQRSKIVGKH